MQHVAHMSVNIKELSYSRIIWFGLLRDNSFFVEFFVWHVAGVQGSAPQAVASQEALRKEPFERDRVKSNYVGVWTYSHMWGVIAFHSGSSVTVKGVMAQAHTHVRTHL